MDNLERFLDLRNALGEEQADILKRLAEIDAALGSALEEMQPGVIVVPRGKISTSKRGQKPARNDDQKSSGPGKSKRKLNEKSLKAVVIEVLSSGKKTKKEILEAVGKTGYEFTTSNPSNSLGVILYGKKPKFKNEDGYFSLK